MPRKKLPYKEGDWIAVPIENDKYIVGKVARSDGRGLVLGYFFEPALDKVPPLDAVNKLQPSDAALIRKFGDLGLIRYGWPVIGQTGEWRREEWPVPVFSQIDIIDSSKTYKVYYDDNVDMNSRKTVRVPPDEIVGLPQDGLSGCGALQTRLERIIQS
jgi:hypothetical protein